MDKMEQMKHEPYEPEKEVIWQNIVSELDKKSKSRRTLRIVSVAASIVFFLGIGIHIYNRSGLHEDDAILNLGLEYEVMEARYLMEIGKMEQQLSAEIKNSELALELKNEITFLDSIYNATIPDLQNNFRKELVVESMMKYYEAKVRMLSRIKMEIDRDKFEKQRMQVSPQLH